MLEFYNILKTAPACLPPFSFSRSTGLPEASFPRLSASRTEELLASEQALSRLPPSAGRREKHSTLGSLGGASSSGGASPEAHPEQMREALPFPVPGRVCSGHLLVIFSPVLWNAEGGRFGGWKRHLQEAATWLGWVNLEAFELLRKVVV